MSDHDESDYEEVLGNPIPLMPTTDVQVPPPRELPAVRDELAMLWAPGGLFESVITAKHEHDKRTGGFWGMDESGKMVRGGDPSVVDAQFDSSNYARWERETIQRAALWWVAEPMCRLLFKAAKEVPDDVRFEDLPMPNDPLLRVGFAVLEIPSVGHSVDDGSNILTVAMTWGPVTLPSFVGHTDAFAMSSYGLLPIPPDTKRGRLAYKADDGTFAYGADAVMPGDAIWYPQGRTDWPMEDAVGVAPWEMPEMEAESFIEDRKLLVALWTLLHQEGLATVRHMSQPQPDESRQVRRQKVRHPERFPDVRIITLRVARRVRDETAEPTGKHWTLDHQSITSGHWRNQPHGPGRKYRRLQWIAPYVRGPAGDEPPSMPDTVRVWKR